MDACQVNISQSDSNTTSADNFTTMEQQQNTIRTTMEEDPIPNDPPPPYESPKKTEVVWDTRPVEYIKVQFVDDEVDPIMPVPEKRIPTENAEMLPHILKLKKQDDPWALSEIDEGTKWSDLNTCEKFRRVTVDWFTKPILIVALLYFFIVSLDLMSSSFRLLGGKEAGEVFSDNKLLQNPICGLMIGILATVLVQSSSTSTSIVVSIVAAGILPVRPAIFIIMGANIGTSVTNTIVSMAHTGNRNEFRRAFGGATIHDMFNWLSVIVLLPVEVATSYLYRLSRMAVDSFNIKTNDEVNVELLKKLTKPFSKRIVMIDSKAITKVATGDKSADEVKLLKEWCVKDDLAVNVTTMVNGTNVTTLEIQKVGIEKCHYLLANTGLSERIVGVILLVCSLAALCICLVCMVKLLNSVLKGRMAGIIKKTINADFPGPLKYLTGYFAIGVGAGVTFLVQSSSVFTSALTPLVGIGVITLERMFPLTLGSNIGTTATGILASLASSGNKLDNSIQIALCHLFFNISGILIWYPLPFMRKVPIYMAKTLGNTTATYRWFAFFYLIMMFFVLPGTIFGLSMISIWALAGVGIPVCIISVFVVIVNVLQRKKPAVLPKKLQDWSFLPEPLRSLDPLDRMLVRAGVFLMSCCPCARKERSLSAIPFNLNGSTLVVQYDPLSTASSVSSTPRTMSTNPSAAPSANVSRMPSVSNSLEDLAIVPIQTSV